LADWLRAVRHCAENDQVSGPVNVTLPEPVTNQEFTKDLGAALHRPTLFPVPSFVLTTVLGEFAWELIGSKRALPNALLSSSFTFSHPTAKTALESALA
jgi:NAD dependent epimerase/dehydratase family enzyme